MYTQYFLRKQNAVHMNNFGTSYSLVPNKRGGGKIRSRGVAFLIKCITWVAVNGWGGVNAQ